jgi:hypothetical protein
VNQIAVKYGGGGHRSASGAHYKGELSTIKKELLEEFSELWILLTNEQRILLIDKPEGISSFDSSVSSERSPGYARWVYRDA